MTIDYNGPFIRIAFKANKYNVIPVINLSE